MQEIITKAQKIASNKSRPSFFVLEHLLINKEPTHQAKLYRAAEEIKSKLKEVKALENQIDDSNDSIKLMELKFKKTKTEINKIEYKMLQRRKQSILEDIDRLKDLKEARLEEIDFLANIYENLSKIEMPKDWDDDSVQLQYHEAKLGNELALRSILGYSQDLEVIKSIMALPDKSTLKQVLSSQIGKPKTGALNAN